MSGTGVTGKGVHIAAAFKNVEAAERARDRLVGAGVAASEVMVLHRGAPRAATAHGLWATLKHVFVPDEDAHHYAEAVTRGCPLLVADVDPARREAAVAALEAEAPIDMESHVDDWEEAGWDGTHPGQDVWLSSPEGRAASGSEGITAGGVMAGDYGAVGAPHGGVSPDTDITRGLRFGGGGSRRMGVREQDERDDARVRVYRIEGDPV